MRLHDVRHTCATLLLAQGVQLPVVMETLGHSQISLTMNTYAHVVPELQREAAERMEAVLAGDETTSTPDPVAVNVAVNGRQAYPRTAKNGRFHAWGVESTRRFEPRTCCLRNRP
jgi:hypothetical protein